MNIFFVLPEKARALLDVFHVAGHKAYVAGACVRDKFMDKVPKSWDIVVSTRLDYIIAIFTNNFPHAIRFSPNKHSIIVTIDDVMFNIYSLDSFRERADFTINSLLYNEEEGLLDSSDSLRDIDNGIIRCVGDPNKNFIETPVNILKALRFSIELGFDIDVSTLGSMLSLKHLLKYVPKSIINFELVKILESGKPIANQFLLCKGIIEELFPDFRFDFSFTQDDLNRGYDIYSHTLKSIDSYKGTDLVVKLALLFLNINKFSSNTNNKDYNLNYNISGAETTRENLVRYQFDPIIVDRVTQLVLYYEEFYRAKNNSLKRLLNKIGEIQVRRLLHMREAIILAHSSDSQRLELDFLKEQRNMFNLILEELYSVGPEDLAVTGIIF